MKESIKALPAAKIAAEHDWDQDKYVRLVDIWQNREETQRRMIEEQMTDYQQVEMAPPKRGLLRSILRGIGDLVIGSLAAVGLCAITYIVVFGLGG